MTALIIPAYAQEGIVTLPPGEPIISPEELAALMQANDDVVFDNGVGTISTASGGIISPPFTHAEDFVLDEDTFITDFHFAVDTRQPDNLVIEYFILSDAGNLPGDLITSGTLQIVQVDEITPFVHMVWTDFEEPIFIKGGVPHWIALHSSDGSAISWMLSNSIEMGFGRVFETTGDLMNWSGPFAEHLWFQLTGHPPDVVGGELLPIDSTALLLAGAQTFSWMIPVVLSVLGIGLFVVSRKSE